MLSRVAEVLTLYRQAPVNSDDVEDLLDHLIKVVPSFVMSGQRLPLDALHNYLMVLDTLMDDDLQSIFKTALFYRPYGER